MKKYHYLITAFICVSVSSLFSQGNMMDLTQCLNYGLEHSPYMTLSKNEMRNFHYDKMDAYAPYLPTLNANAGFDYNAKLPVTVIPAGGLAPVEIRMKMGLMYANSAAIQLEQKIYDQSAIIGIHGMKDYRVLAEMNSEKFQQTMIYNLAIAYYQVLVIDKQSELLEANEKQYADLLKIVELQFEKGVVKKVDVNRIKVAHNNIISQLNLVKSGRETALGNLKSMMGMPIDEPLQIDENQTMLKSISMPTDQSNDISNRIDFKINTQTEKLQDLHTRVMKYSFLPTLSGYARYGANSYADDFKGSFQKFNDFSTLGLKLNIPIFNGLKANTAYNKQRIQLENLKVQNKMQEDGFKVELLNAKNKLQESYTSYSTNQENLDLAKEVYDMTTLSYQNGASSLSDFLNADYSYKEAQNNFMTSMINLLSSRLDYEKSKGNLFNYLNINK